MAQTVNEKKYEAMIEALALFANNVSEKATQMKELGGICARAMGNNDEGVAKACEQLRACERKYLDACKKAVGIAQDMQAELDAQRKERELWDNEDVSE